MEDLLLNPNFQLNKPIIYFKVNGELTIMGRSINENIVEYYQPALDWLMLLKETPPATITLTINLEYFNTKSSMIILHFFKILKKCNLKNYLKSKSTGYTKKITRICWNPGMITKAS